MMPLAEPSRQRLERLRMDYRAAFSEWVAARNSLTGEDRDAAAESEAQSREAAASIAYRNARNHLVDAMSE